MSDAKQARGDWAAATGLLTRAQHALDEAVKAKLGDPGELQKLLSKMRSTTKAVIDQLAPIEEDHAAVLLELDQYQTIIGLDDLARLNQKIIHTHTSDHEGGFATCPQPICKSAADAGFDPRQLWQASDDS
jgi:hypothetical protein